MVVVRNVLEGITDRGQANRKEGNPAPNKKKREELGKAL